MARRRTTRCRRTAIRRTANRKGPQRGGFTLVEMLISVTLVLLMMTMFTSIFQMATETVSTQRGIAQNNQRARALVTTIKADLAKRTMRYGLPFYPNEASGTSPTEFGTRAGYLYISANDPDSWQDDLLQFTVNVNLSQEDTDDTQYFGSAKLLYDLGADPAFGDSLRRTTLRSNPNQPDADDGRLIANEVGASSAAEVTYFIRNGGLYRRVMLLREPLPVAGQELAVTPDSAVSGNAYFNTLPAPGGLAVGGVFAFVGSPGNILHTVDPSNTYHYQLVSGEPSPVPGAGATTPSWNTTATNDFWRYFDYSATPTLVATGGSNPPLPSGAAFNGIDSLDNTLGFGAAIGNPANRFGFNIRTGLSREHDNATASRLFIGRFTHAETSHPDFNWPAAACRVATVDSVSVADASGASDYNALNSGALIGNGNPMDIAGTSFALDQSTGVISQFAGTTGRGGPRRVEDLLLANVHGFRVEIWDDRLERFVQPGHSSLTQIRDAGGNLQVIAGDYHTSRRMNAAHGPTGLPGAATNLNRVFDTWHPGVSFDYDGSGSIDNNSELAPPFMAYRYYPPRQNDGFMPNGGGGTYPAGPGPMPTGMISPYLEYDAETGVNQRNKGVWVGSDFSDADETMWTYHSYNVGDVVFARPNYDGDDTAGGPPHNPADEVFEWGSDTLAPTGFQIGYRCVRAGYAADPSDYGTRGQPSWPRVPGQKTTEFNKPLAAGVPAIWESFDNRRPLRSIRVTVQFYDQNTEKLRQLSIVLPMTTER